MTGFVPLRYNEDAALGLIEFVKYHNKGIVGTMVYTINASQAKFAPALLRAGFTEFFDSINPGHGPNHIIKGYVFDFKNYKKTVDENEVFKL